MIRRLLLLVALLVVPLSASAGTVTVFAAASLRGSLDEVARAFEAQQKATKIVISYAGSSALARQIEAGAPADVFISADEDWMDYLAAKNLIQPDSRRDLLGNSLVLIAPTASAKPVEIKKDFPLAKLLGKDRLAMATVATVPAGKYGKAALQSLGVWSAVEGQVAEAENVRAALAFVARGETPYGIVYGTDALAEPGVRVVGTFPASSHPAILYPVALLRDAGSLGEATAFLGFLKGTAARSIFASHGFTLP
ncbi:molybdate ABC transporter substrate-binding protein [Govanella unica]|uniref:Molybdate ABC transporter substrate-binding protein n=1 Tax=Govanella unica TaxID=2975056 RepID=A0A9X3Z835_9PROT|nr:molybdate ABC transporter substrate-binding protein [Govania unica]MDA5194746.1 molybdate ABC transporter substrate-binding protein [Govania unica]